MISSSITHDVLELIRNAEQEWFELLEERLRLFDFILELSRLVDSLRVLLKFLPSQNPSVNSSISRNWNIAYRALRPAFELDALFRLNGLDYRKLQTRMFPNLEIGTYSGCIDIHRTDQRQSCRSRD